MHHQHTDIVLFHLRMNEVKDEFRDKVEDKGVEAVDVITEEVKEKRPGHTTRSSVWTRDEVKDEFRDEVEVKGVGRG